MKLSVNPIPAWKTASAPRRVVAVILYLASAALIAASIASWPFTIADGAVWGRILLFAAAYLTFDLAHVALRGSKAREQILESMRERSGGKKKSK